MQQNGFIKAQLSRPTMLPVRIRSPEDCEAAVDERATLHAEAAQQAGGGRGGTHVRAASKRNGSACSRRCAAVGSPEPGGQLPATARCVLTAPWHTATRHAAKSDHRRRPACTGAASCDEL